MRHSKPRYLISEAGRVNRSERGSVQYTDEERVAALYTLRYPDVHTSQQLAEAKNVVLGRDRNTRDSYTDVYAKHR